MVANAPNSTGPAPDDYEGRLEAMNEWVMWDPDHIPTRFTATKVHATQYGSFVGLVLGGLAAVGPDIPLRGTVYNPAFLSLLAVFAFLMLAFSVRILPANIPRLFCVGESIAVLKIQHKPHYFASGLLGAWALGHLAVGRLITLGAVL